MRSFPHPAVFALVAAGFFLYGFSTQAISPADFGLIEGDLVSASGSSDPDIYIVNQYGYKRLFLNPTIFNFYGHLKWSNVRSISSSTRDAFVTSGLFRNCEQNDPKVYGVEITAEDGGTLHWVNVSGETAVAQDPEFFRKVFCINSSEFNWYGKSAEYSSVSQVPQYDRSTIPAVSVQTVSYQSGGLMLTGYLCTPSGAGPYPGVVYNHGGLGTTIGGAPEETCTALAQDGFVGFSPIRRQTISLDGHLDDVLAGADYLKNLSYVDRNRLGIMGFSRGGLLTYMASTVRSDFKAVISTAPAPAGNTLASYLPEAWKVTAPVLILVAENDTI